MLNVHVHVLVRTSVHAPVRHLPAIGEADRGAELVSSPKRRVEVSDSRVATMRLGSGVGGEVVVGEVVVVVVVVVVVDAVVVVKVVGGCVVVGAGQFLSMQFHICCGFDCAHFSSGCGVMTSSTHVTLRVRKPAPHVTEHGLQSPGKIRDVFLCSHQNYSYDDC